MFTLAGLLPLLVVVYVRPQELVPSLQGVPLLHALSLLTMVGFVLDHRLGYARLRMGPLLALALACFGWSEVTLLAAAPEAIRSETVTSFTSLFLFLAISQGVQTFRAIRIVAATLLALALLLAAIAIQQRSAPLQCHRPELDGKHELWVTDGRPCETRASCLEGVLDDDVTFRCEHAGLLGTSSVEGRVKWRGIMEDPNELALVLAASLSFAFAFVALRPSLPRFALATGALAAIGLATVFTQSRSGQLAFAAVLAVYLLRRLRSAGLALGALLATPVLLLGGRSDAKASTSSMDRLEAWLEGIEMWRSSPIWGVGKGQFSDHHWLTAHNSFVLVLAEQGTVGLLLWTALLLCVGKTLVAVARRARALSAPVPLVWANALTAATSAVLVSAFFLSFAYHNVFWIFLGLVASLYGATLRHDAELTVLVRPVDLAVVAAVDTFLTAAIFVYARFKGA